VPDDCNIDPPFGFDTRVVALWRSGTTGIAHNGLGQLVGRTLVLAAAIILLSGAASWRELSETRELADTDDNEYAVADAAIQTELYQ
jgi:hypothetical protein